MIGRSFNARRWLASYGAACGREALRWFLKGAAR